MLVQAAGDNNDINAVIIDGKRTTHAAKLVLFKEVSSDMHPNYRSTQTKQRGSVQLNRWFCVDLSDSTVQTENGQLLHVSPE